MFFRFSILEIGDILSFNNDLGIFKLVFNLNRKVSNDLFRTSITGLSTDRSDFLRNENADNEVLTSLSEVSVLVPVFSILRIGFHGIVKSDIANSDNGRMFRVSVFKGIVGRKNDKISPLLCELNLLCDI